MRQCLTNPEGGYYTTTRTEGRDPFGRRGDFITSPEISQMFGEMIGIWIVAEWMAQGKKKHSVQIVELGPGRGTLMDDVLRTLNSFKSLRDAISEIYLIEASASLRETQRKLLCGEATSFESIKKGERCMSKYGIPIVWYEDLSFVPTKTTATPPTLTTPFILAHEFFDALPIHAFTSTTNGWRELLVHHLPPRTTHATLHTPRSQSLEPVPEFALTTAKSQTPHSAILPELSPRYKALKKHVDATIEISPESLTIMESISTRIGDSKSGAALIIDYGTESHIPVHSLRGIRAHRTVSPFINPGEVDLSADVDFMALAERALDASPDVEVHGPVQQGTFLGMMGMKERMGALTGGMREDDETKRLLESGYKRLVDRGVNGMGRIYKAMAVVPESGGRRPVGFGGGVVDT
ncbi:DUF185-domain-containing protein [Morchella conica CCBAS932]|uniref:Protein arginine methyltransferase NDUFAF7 n=1 Tax=Morchella conica CCBAS932 TaxID=1392247 RepID=A0A3N4KCT5_9PEZI|nr:DUF185-domain-containing protein [Morchella conica CCBAS932]